MSSFTILLFVIILMLVAFFILSHVAKSRWFRIRSTVKEFENHNIRKEKEIGKYRAEYNETIPVEKKLLKNKMLQ